ncbi:hypothetical protein OVA24_19055 [Luteolibacter sp. SL250]|uniref:hypothetical protein n=1 Tax=Luteolibacter sp. SL250 TaxID=2995170 RepID=UPI00226DD924|nr:hypothetical protein [Luteolibacter sp. SL250]WAC19329.1 hypothetical protein OVA24_19055 [Luteolibacter sp. SL250]
MKILLLMLGLSGVSFAAAGDPAAAVLEYLEKVRQRTVDLGTDTALSPHTSTEKREQISRRLSRLADDLGKGSLEAAEVKVDDNLAAVIVRNTGGFDPSKIRVVSIGLVRMKDAWLPAPVPSSFENTGTGLVAAARQRLGQLETWMMRGQAEQLTALREQSRERMRKDILASMDPEILRDESPEKVTNQFLAACRKRDLPVMLGFLGGLQDTPPDDWAERLRSADAAVVAGRKVGWPWRLLIAPEVVRVRVEDGGETHGSLFSFGCLDPAGSGMKQTSTRVEILHIELSRDEEGLWKVDLPPAFLLPPGEELDESEDDFVKSLLDEFPGEIRKQISARPQPSIAEAAASLDDALRKDSLDPLISLMDLEGDPGTASRGCALGARLWWLVHNPQAPRLAQLLGYHENGRAGVVTFQFFSPREPGTFDLRSFYLEKTAAGWLLFPGLKLTNSPSKEQSAVRDWVTDRERAWRGGWQAKLAEGCTRIDPIAEGNAPAEDDARKLVEEWLSATHSADFPAALRSIVIVNRQGETERTLRNLGFEFTAALRDEGKASIIHSERGSTWTVVGVKSQTGMTTTFPLYLVVTTHQGPRILIGSDLFGDSTSGRNKLNETVLERIRACTTPGSAEELKSLLDRFRDKTGG